MQTIYYDKQVTAKIAKPVYENVLRIAQNRGLCLSEYLRSLIVKDVQSHREDF